ncbi:hypothetical protein [Metabacillus malikii]|uniref:J domain-containing protein n=1 Tax=Metabacillus malikii TaxID=1504265 RepID=A0ABT9ZET3_9BACI|nr:hypothetical protein [Metabacillus malikii]MDQ0230753.1 hypothetical protein [Metabacillus malikii]
MNIKEAYTILDVSEEATDEEIEKQYMIWVRKDRAYKDVQPDEKPFDIDEITSAYNTIKTYRLYGSETPPKVEMTTRKKLNHFLYYHKLHIVGVIALLAILSSIIYTSIENYQEKKALESLPPENIRVLLLGEYFNASNDPAPVSDNLLSLMPEWERVTVNLNYSPLTINNSMDVASQQKSVVTLVDDKSDLFIMDVGNFERLVTTNIFQPLDEVDPSITEAVESDKLLYTSTEDIKAEKLYGIVIDDKSYFKGFDMNQDAQLVAAIKVGAENDKNAMKMIKKLIEKTD